MKRISITIFVFLLSITAASAADLSTTPMGSDPWGGFYIGGSVGGGTTSSSFSYFQEDVNFDNGVLDDIDTTLGRGTGGETTAAVIGFAGINSRIGRFVVGGQLEGALTQGDFNTGLSVGTSDQESSGSFPDTVEIRSDWALSRRWVDLGCSPASARCFTALVESLTPTLKFRNFFRFRALGSRTWAGR